MAYVHSRQIKPDLRNWPPPEDYQVRILEPDELHAAAVNTELEMTPAFLEEAIAGGHWCIGAYHDGELVSYAWRSVTDAPGSDDFRIRLHQKLRYGYKSLTLPDHRGRHLQSYLSCCCDQYSLPRGYERSISYVETHNYPSLTGDWRRGNQISGLIAWMDKGPIRWSWTSPRARRLGLELVDARRGGA
ncbi:MAG: hypothetical protein AAGG11_03395 [Pseudomonadota bacterium]